LGRLDDQVKVAGNRVELAEVEAVLRTHPLVRDVVVVASERHGEKFLAAYIEAQGTKPSVRDLRNFLREKLPDYMIPSSFTFIPKVPLLPNGKLDRRALPVPSRVRPSLETPFVAPRNSDEARLAAIWQGVLGMEDIGVDDSFFELGGSSISAMQV